MGVRSLKSFLRCRKKFHDLTITSDINNDQFCDGNDREEEDIVKSKSKAITNAHLKGATNMGLFHQDVVTANGAINVVYNELDVFLEKCFHKTNTMQCTWENIFAVVNKKYQTIFLRFLWKVKIFVTSIRTYMIFIESR